MKNPAMAGKRKISRAEETLWRQVTDGIKPLSPGAEPTESQTPSDDITVKKARAPENKDKAKPARKTPPPAAPVAAKPQPELAPGKSAGLDKRNAQRLKRGQLRPEARVDLHGMIQREAHAALNDFIAESYMAGLRNVLVITGKGRRANLYDLGSDDLGPDNRGWGDEAYRGPRGGLREAVPKWLQVGAQRNQILAIEPARPQHGGDGAFYVLLRRKRT